MFFRISSHIMGIMIGNSKRCLAMKQELIANCADLDFGDVVEYVEGYFQKYSDDAFATILCGSKSGSAPELFGIQAVGIQDDNSKKPSKKPPYDAYEKVTFCSFGSGSKHMLKLADKLAENGFIDPRTSARPISEGVKFVEKCILHGSLHDRNTGGYANVYYETDGEWIHHSRRDVLDIYLELFDYYKDEPLLFLIVGKKTASDTNLTSKDLIGAFREYGEVTNAHRLCEICVKGTPFYFHILVCKTLEDSNNIIGHLQKADITMYGGSSDELYEFLDNFLPDFVIKEKNVRVCVAKAAADLLEHIRSFKTLETEEKRL